MIYLGQEKQNTTKEQGVWSTVGTGQEGGGEFKPTLSLVSNSPGISIFYSSSTDAMHASTLMEKSGCNSLAAWFKVFLIKNWGGSFSLMKIIRFGLVETSLGWLDSLYFITFSFGTIISKKIFWALSNT